MAKILHAWADFGLESLVLRKYGTVTKATLKPKNKHIPVHNVKCDGKRLPFASNSFDFGLFHPFCQKWSTCTPEENRENHPDVLDTVRKEAKRLCKYWVIENVPQAPLIDATILKGHMFDLPITYHRAFESNFEISQPRDIIEHKNLKNRHKWLAIGENGKKQEWLEAKGYGNLKYTIHRSSWHNASRGVIPKPYIDYIMKYSPIEKSRN